MRFTTLLASGCAFAALAATPSFAQQAAPAPQAAADIAGDEGEIIVTARKRNETLLDVPVAVTAISGDTLAKRNINSVREAALLSPGLNIASDGAGRAFISIRGVGNTLVGTVQPGVGLFVDGIYRPNTAYLNNPLLDVERIEVLRGPQGTLYGKNTLGGAINVITRQPGNEFSARGQASYAGPDNAWLVSGSVSAPIVQDKLAIRIAASHREQDGFINNVTIGGKSNPLNTDSLNATIRATPSEDVTITLNGYYDWIKGTNTPYARVSGPTNYLRTNQFNALGITNYRYRGVNAKIEAPLDALNTKITLQAAYDLRNTSAPDNDADFGPDNVVRSSGTDKLRTKTVELRFDTTLNDQFSTLVGLFYSKETLDSNLLQNIIPLARTVRTIDHREGDTSAVFGTLFWKPNPGWEVAAGLRYDHELRKATGSVAGTAIPSARIKSNQVQPKLTVTRHWDSTLMTYASVARGYRGGGFNPPNAPFRTYKGDSAWTYELGTKYATRGVTLSADIFYNDYKDYIGLNSIAPAVPAGLVTVDLNSGDIESYGFEIEAAFKPTPQWTISGSMTYQHSRLTDSSAYTRATNRVLSSDRLTFTPDLLFSLTSDYVVPVGDDTLTFSGGVQGKGKRLAATLNQTTPTFLKGYALVNGSIAYRHGPVELALFGTNLFNKKYFESYIEKTTLQLAGLPASDLGIIGDRRRYGVRASFAF
ncbi:TonB-dependent receptor [Rhizorhabdus dicambivorans]|uniref:TonB-dependent receptor n=1 Tax=Rhizorhabdus dicambivorans TaxID=1850238 RepID=A0A2A4FT98_9SPHN|nr:TonB-dependent receptor [Rhizorhabdus dicambivorans]ATE64539.1 TonB-dependent receptor [Rhizorhabdus dicambivorans]PCE41633.1 TonB-dependent receptor [Rhizorhabdus dicambivorans]